MFRPIGLDQLAFNEKAMGGNAITRHSPGRIYISLWIHRHINVSAFVYFFMSSST